MGKVENNALYKKKMYVFAYNPKKEKYVGVSQEWFKKNKVEPADLWNKLKSHLIETKMKADEKTIKVKGQKLDIIFGWGLSEKEINNDTIWKHNKKKKNEKKVTHKLVEAWEKEQKAKKKGKTFKEFYDEFCKNKKPEEQLMLINAKGDYIDDNCDYGVYYDCKVSKVERYRDDGVSYVEVHLPEVTGADEYEILAYNISWDCSDDDLTDEEITATEEGLPKKVEMTIEAEDEDDLYEYLVADKLSDDYGFCVNGCDIEILKKNGEKVKKKTNTIEDIEAKYKAGEMTYDKACDAIIKTLKCSRGDAQGMVDLWENSPKEKTKAALMYEELKSYKWIGAPGYSGSICDISEMGTDEMLDCLETFLSGYTEDEDEFGCNIEKDKGKECEVTATFVDGSELNIIIEGDKKYKICRVVKYGNEKEGLEMRKI